MVISTVKGFNICTIGKKRLERPGFGKRLGEIANLEELKEEIGRTIVAEGRVYGIYKKKELVGVYLFEKVKDYFVENENLNVKLGNREFNFEKFWYGSNTEALRFKRSICLDEVKDFTEKIEQDLKADLSDQISLGSVAGVEWGEQLMYRKNLHTEPSGGIWGSLFGFGIGFFTGWMIFHDWEAFGLAFFYATIWGGVGVAVAKDSEIDTKESPPPVRSTYGGRN